MPTRTINAEIAEIAEFTEGRDRFDAVPQSGGGGLRESEYKLDKTAPGLYF